MLHALFTTRSRPEFGGLQIPGKAFDNLWTNRDQLNAYTRSLLALGAIPGLPRQGKTLVENLENGVKLTRARHFDCPTWRPASDPSVIATAHWEDGLYWRWSDGGVDHFVCPARCWPSIQEQTGRAGN